MPEKPRIESVLLDALQQACPGDWTTEIRPFAGRRWRIDVGSESQKLAVEIQGSFHVSHGQLRKDAEKYNALTLAGWRVLIYPASSVSTKKRFIRIVEQIARAYCHAGPCESDFNILTGD